MTVNQAKNWQLAKLGSLAVFKTGKLDSNAAVPDGLYPFFTCSQETLRTNTYSFDTECVLLAGNKANGIFPLKYFTGRFDAYQRTYIIIPRDPNLLVTRFLYYALNQKLSEFRSVSTGVATKFLTLTILNETTIRLPVINVQHRIVDILSAYDDLIEVNTRRIAILEEMARRVFVEWFVADRLLDVRRASSIDQLPAGWRRGIIADVACVQSGYAFKSKSFEARGSFRVVTIRNVQDGAFLDECNNFLSVVPENMGQQCYLHTGGILLSLTGNVGRCCLVVGENFLLNQRVAKIVPKSFPRSYVYFLFRDPRMCQRLEQISHGVAQQNLSPVMMLEVELALPPADLLEHFAVLSEPSIDQILILRRSNSCLRAARDLLLPKLISGEIDLEQAEHAVNIAAKRAAAE